MLVNIQPRIQKPLLGSVQVDWGHPLVTGLQACWLFNEGAGLTLRNSTQTFGNAPITMGTGFWTPSVQGIALSLDGTTTFAQANRPSTILSTVQANKTLMCWARFTSVPAGNKNLVTVENNTVNTSAQLDFRASAVSQVTNNGGGSVVSSNFTSLTGVWYHYAYTWDGTTNSIYVNGNLKNTSTTASQTGATTAIGIGSFVGSGAEFFAGQISGIRIYNIALQAKFVQWSFAEPYAFLKPIPAVRYWSIPPPAAAGTGAASNTLYRVRLRQY